MKEPAFFQYLRTVSQVATLVGQKIYPVRAPQGIDRPFVVWDRIGVERQQMDCAASPLVKGLYQFACYGVSYQQAMDVHAAIWSALQDFHGLMGDVMVRQCHCTSDLVRDDEDPAIHRVVQSWDVWYVET